MTAALSAADLSKQFGGLSAVDRLSLEVRHGELFGLVGSDGAGKTTTIRMLTGVLAPTSGTAAILGVDCTGLDVIRNDIGYMSQRFALYPDLTVAENIHFHAAIFDVPRNEEQVRGEQLLAASGMLPFRNRKAGALSGGMKQKLGLACALIHTPKILFLDEPTNGVDPVSRREFWRILYELNRDGVTIFVATSYLDEADRCNRVGLLHEGRLLDCDTPARLRGSMTGTMLELQTENTRKAFTILKSGLPAAPVNLFGDRLHIATDDPPGTTDTVTRLMSENGMQMASCVAIEPSIEDIFVSLTGHAGADRQAPTVAIPAARSRATDGRPAVSVRGLGRRFGDFIAVNGIDLDVAGGEIFGFLGPNGAGKSTTIRMLCGILQPTSGSGTVAGCDIVSQTEEIKKRIGYMSQKFSLYEELTVEENIRFYGGIYRIAGQRLADRAEWVIGMAGLADRRRSLTRELSGGWKQRLALGCALLHEPPVVFLDEPTAGVDPASRRSFWELINVLAAAGTTIFVTTHYMDEAEYCDRLAMIHQGEIISLGSPAELKNRTVRQGRLASMEDVFVSLIETRQEPAQHEPHI